MQGYKKSHEVCTDHATSDSHFLMGSTVFQSAFLKKMNMEKKLQQCVPRADSDTEISH